MLFGFPPELFFDSERAFAALGNAHVVVLAATLVL
jgi:hypothetical protein